MTTEKQHQDHATYVVGEHLIFKGLKNHPELNGRQGTIIGPIKKSNGCYPVRLEATDEAEARTVYVSPQSLNKKKVKKNAKSAKVGEHKPHHARKHHHSKHKKSDKAGKDKSHHEVPHEKKYKSSPDSREYPGASAPPGHSIPDDDVLSIPIHDDAPSEHQNDAANCSNDTANNQESQKEVGNGVGCCVGFLRDRHSGILISSTLFIAFGVLYAAYVLSSSTCAIVCIIAGLFYLCTACKSNTFKYLWNVVTTETAMEYIYRMYNAAPEIAWHIQCYHMEKRIRYVQRYDYTSYSTDWSGRTVETVHYKTVPEEYWVRVDTHSANGNLHYIGWNEVSIPVKQERIEEHRLTKVLVNRYWHGDPGAYAQRTDFIARNNLDVEFDFSETLIIPGYCKRFMGLNDINDRPFLLHWMWYIISHITVVYAYPFLIYASSISDKVEIEVIKQVWTEEPSPYDDGGGARIIPPFNGQSRKEGKRPTRYCWCLGFVFYTACIGFLAYFIAIRAVEEAGIKALYPGCTVDKLYQIGNGICDGEEYNTEQCGWDGSDCVLYDYPECHVNITSLLGDGRCDGSEYNTEECGWDGGDCMIKEYPDCHIDRPNLLGDGWCCCTSSCESVDQVWVEACGWDGGDCLKQNYDNDDPSYCPYEDNLF